MSNIEWCDRTWNPTRGCTRVSEGCRNCYAERQAIRQSGPGGGYEGLVVSHEGGPRWTGKVRFVDEKLDEPLRWKKPARVFVNSMSDLFHEGLSDGEVAAVFRVMAQAKQHTFQVLTKRPERMRAWMAWAATELRFSVPLPLPNVWLGVSVENQAAADERIPLLLQTPAAVRFLSVEPMLGPVNLERFFTQGCLPACGWHYVEGQRRLFHTGGQCRGGLHWVIVGGESGPGARACVVAWVRSIVEQCRFAGVACFVKQLGARVADVAHDGGPGTVLTHLINRKGGDMAEWPAGLRVREFPSVAR